MCSATGLVGWLHTAVGVTGSRPTAVRCGYIRLLVSLRAVASGYWGLVVLGIGSAPHEHILVLAVQS